MAIVNKNSIYFRKGLERALIFVLYLTFVYWSMEACLKYVYEPTQTKVHYTLGDDGKNINVPLITICDKQRINVKDLKAIMFINKLFFIFFLPTLFRS